jgi:hypothetical protein
MALMQLTLENLHNLDMGAAAAAFKVALERAVRDCIARPSDDRARKVTFEFALKPVKDINDNVITCEGAKGSFKVRAKIPDWETRECDFGVKTNGMLYFSEESPQNHRQQSFHDQEKAEE